MTQLLSVVIPVYGNETTLLELRDRLSAALRTIADMDFELIFVDDASPDGSWATVTTMASADPKVVGVRLASNVGQMRASCAGIDAARGDVFVSIDADLEHPPEAIPRLVHAFREGHDLVVARRRGRASDPIRVVGTIIANSLARALRLPVADVGSSFLVCSPAVAAEMRRLVDWTGRQMILPTVFEAALNPTSVEVELTEATTSAYPLRRVVELGGEYAAAELCPVMARQLLLVAGNCLLLAIHRPWRRRAMSLAASMAGLGLIGLLMPSLFRRDRTEPLYEVVARVASRADHDDQRGVALHGDRMPPSMEGGVGLSMEPRPPAPR